ncbi:MAG: flavodoxin domain-containing protein [Candidatus Thorarchaeota archaeon]
MEKHKILIAYGTRYGATASTAKEIAQVLESQGLEVNVIDLKKEKIRDISNFDLIIVGSGMQMHMYTGKVKSFLKRFSPELKKKKVAIFVSSGARALLEYKGENDEIKKMITKYLEEKPSKYGLKPISTAMFGGIWDYNKVSKIFRKFLDPEREHIIAAGIEEKEPGVYDTRNWDEIHEWAKQLVGKI